jgi:hypothetical protein
LRHSVIYDVEFSRCFVEVFSHCQRFGEKHFIKLLFASKLLAFLHFLQSSWFNSTKII